MTQFTITKEYDTEYSADSVEFCPIPDYTKNLLVGTYQLQNSVKYGRILHFRDTVEVSRVETPAILDLKWSHRTLNDSPVFAAATEKDLSIYSLSETLAPLETYQYEEGVLCLSIDWQNRLSHTGHNLVTSSSNGHISYFKLGSERLNLIHTWEAHNFEAWIAAFDYHDTNRVYSGADDCLFKILDIRAKSVVLTNKSHGAGVTTVSSHPLVENMLVTGSYDEYIRVWDTRQMRTEVQSINTGGGVWRLKWHPTDPSLLLSACMYNGFHVFRVDGMNSISHLLEYKKHESIAYGADWSFENPNLIGTCSFYDHLFTLWSFDE